MAQYTKQPYSILCQIWFIEEKWSEREVESDRKKLVSLNNQEHFKKKIICITIKHLKNKFKGIYVSRIKT